MDIYRFTNSKVHFLSNRAILALAALFIIIMTIGYFTLRMGIDEFINYANEQRKSALKDKVNLALSAIKPIREKLKNEKIDKKLAEIEAIKILNNLIYKDEFGQNYIFMNKIDGTVLVRPFRPQDIGKNVININDSKGNKYMKMLSDNAIKHPNGAFTKYYFPKPITKNEEEKLSYAVYISEFDAYIGTGTYMSTATTMQIDFMKEWMFWALLFGFLLTIPIGLALIILRKRTHQLRDEFIKNIGNTKKIIKQEEDLRITLDSIGDAVIATDEYGIITRFNYVASQITAFSSEEALGKHITKILNIYSKDTGDNVICPVDFVIKNSEKQILTDDIILVSNSGDIFNVNISSAPILNIENECIGAVVIIRNITEETLLKSSSEQNSNNFRIIFDSSPFSITITSAITGEYLLVNKQFEKHTGFKKEEIIGKSVIDIGMVERDENYFKAIKVLEVEKKIDNAFYTSKTKAGEIRSGVYSSRIITYNDEPAVLSLIVDLTETLKLQDQLHHAQKMDAIGQLAGGIAHDFNNMLAGILGSAEILSMPKLDPEKREKYIKIIIDSTQRAGDLTKKLLTFARKGRIESTPVNSNKALEDALELLMRSLDKKISLITEFNAKKTTIVGDLSQLMNIFLNLGINASHAMPNGGTIKFTNRNVYLDKNFCDASNFELIPGEYVLYEVIDDGVGIAPENLSKIFDPFFTTKDKSKGTGLGLSTVFGAVQQHKGAVSVYSELNKGTVFHIYLPLINSDQEVFDEEQKAIKGSGNILIIDDEEVIRITANAILDNLGYQVYMASDGLSGIKKYHELQDSIDLIILDMIMPGMNGKECFYELKKINPNAKIIISSGFSREEDLIELKEAGLQAFIRKPFHTADLSLKISEILNKNA